MAISSGIVGACRQQLSFCGGVYFAQSERRCVQLDKLASPGGGLIGMLPVEHNDPVNAKILAVSGR